MNRINANIFLAALCCACSGNPSVAPSQEENAKEALAVVSVKTVETENVVKDGVYSATILANAINNIAPQSAGRIQKLNVEVGDFVSAGQVVAEMDKVQLEQAKLKLNNAKVELDRVQQMLEEGGISQSDFDQLQLSFNVSKTSYENLLENTILTSPLNGVISARNYDRGDMYAMAQPIYTVQQITPVKLLIPVSEKDYTRVKKGGEVDITVDALPGRTYKGYISRLYPVMDATSHTFSVEVKVANANRELRPGMFARACIIFGVDNSVVIPDVAVLKQQGSGVRSVYVLDSDNVARLKNVVLGVHFDGKYEIVSGLEAGETLVVRGASTLRNGQKVEVLE